MNYLIILFILTVVFFIFKENSKKSYLCSTMRTVKNLLLITCLSTALFLSSSVNASSIVTGTTIESKKAEEKYSLKNLGSLAHKTATFYTLKSSLEFKGFSNSSIVSNNYLKYNIRIWKLDLNLYFLYFYEIIINYFLHFVETRNV
jgi:hypothetical protein